VGYAITFKQIYSTFEKNLDLISVGAYKNGADAEIDRAIQLYPHLQQFLTQGANEKSTLSQSLEALKKLTVIEESEP